MKKLHLIAILLTTIYSLSVSQTAQNPLLTSFEEYQFKKKNSLINLNWIQTGPVMNSARVEAVQGIAGNPATFYCAFGSGNLWKTTNSGLTWKPIFENQPSLGIGDFAVSPSHPETIWLGTGESLKKARNFTMPGTGVYRSDDGGISWQHKGLEGTWHIGEIIVHPENPDIVYVAALGHLWSTNPERGIYMSEDGGLSWKHVLYVNERTGAIDIVISPSDPSVLYASLWENNPGISGPGSAVYASVDGGKTWEKRSEGLPDGDHTGRIGLAVSAQNPYKVYALVDNLNRDKNLAAEVYLSTNGGMSWEKTHKDDLLIFPGIGWYFADIYVNPVDDNEIYTLGVRLARSSDGGKTFSNVNGNVFHLNPNRATPLHLDMCEMWIDPLFPSRLLLGNDGGLYQSYDRGETWFHMNNIPAGEFYDISTDKQNPYMIYGGTQDDASVYGPSRKWNPLYADGWDYVWLDAWAGGDGCITFPDPDDPNTVFFSSQNGYARKKFMKADSSVSIMPRQKGKNSLELSYAFVAPYFISPHNNNVMYHAGNYIFKSNDKGDSWTPVSPDLSRSERSDLSTACGAIAESPLRQGLLYAGTDRGLFWVSTDDGKHWDERGNTFPEHYIRSICPSQFSEGRVYVAITGINNDDLGNYLYASEDYGATWNKINSDLPDEIANVIVEDPTNENILYAGLYRGVYVSTDRGETWSLLGQGMPACSIADIEIQENTMDLVAGTHGRGIFKINIRPLQEMINNHVIQGNYLFPVADARLPYVNDTHRDIEYSSIPTVPVCFILEEDQEVTISLVDKDETIWETKFKAKKGLNQFDWDLITGKSENQHPYFIKYLSFPSPGNYEITLSGIDFKLKREIHILKHK